MASSPKASETWGETTYVCNYENETFSPSEYEGHLRIVDDSEVRENEKETNNLQDPFNLLDFEVVKETKQANTEFNQTLVLPPKLFNNLKRDEAVSNEEILKTVDELNEQDAIGQSTTVEDEAVALVEEDSFSHSAENDSSGTINLLESARRASLAFDLRAAIGNFSTTHVHSDNASNLDSKRNYDFLDKSQSQSKDSKDSPVSEPLNVNDDVNVRLQKYSSEATPTRPVKSVGVVAPQKRENLTEAEMLKEIETVKEKINKLKEQEIASEMKVLEAKKERELWTQKYHQSEARVKNLEQLAEKKENVTSRLLAKLASRHAILENQQKEKEQLNKACNGGIAKLQLETTVAERTLRDAENAFADIHGRYERSKVAGEAALENIEKLQIKASELRDLIAEKEDEIIEVQQIAESKKEESQKMLQELAAAHAAEKSRLTAILRKTELKVSTLTGEIERANLENERLGSFFNDYSKN